MANLYIQYAKTDLRARASRALNRRVLGILYTRLARLLLPTSL